MECLGKKRKGVEISSECQKDLDEQTELAILWSIVNGVVTAPACGAASLELPGRGLKRKIGCIDAATRLGRKKKIDQEYELAKTIGKGKFGSVLLCRSKATGEEFACKTLRKGEEIVHREVEIMQHLSGHPGVVTLKAVYEDTESFYLVMELCSGGRLLDQMAREGLYSEQKAANIIKELMLAIRFWIGCENLDGVSLAFLQQGGCDVHSQECIYAEIGQRLTGVVGSPAYVAPEVLMGNYSEKVDIWSTGVLLHALLVGVLPFQGDSLETVFEAIKKEKLDFTGGVWESVSQPARDLLSGMLTRNIATRFTANEVLKHPWISFYTEPMLKTRALESKNNVKLTSRQLASIHVTESERKRLISCNILNDDSSPSLASSGSTEAVDGEDCGLVDVLAVAISRVRISEPKRSRICSPSQQECSSNLKTSNLCTAF
ncbi:Serine/threonine-protein kinase PEPKR2 [Sesamum angolense]|uniref:Serine/threonine-protein kinase PEPKR2 n=1 Tax=Sesamum angolense TaxID=2727404 RepID=A0AAE1WYC4_9LAMI|nr:Serine/threonine-protein kinase PEPKR2 [Sesamum angolense]